MIRFDFVSRSSCDGKRMVLKNGKWGIINEREEITVPIEYDKLTCLKRYKLVLFKKDKCHGIMDLNGNIILNNMELEYIHPITINTGLLIVKDIGGHKGMYDTSGKRLIFPEYEKIKFVSDELIILTKDSRVFLYNISSMTIVLCDYEPLGCFGSVVIVKDEYGRYGGYDAQGKLLIPPEYVDFNYANHTIIMTSFDGFDIYNLEGNYQRSVNDFKFVRILGSGNIVVRRKRKLGVIDPNGNVIIKPEYQDVDELGKGLYDVVRNGRHALITKDAQITPFIYGMLFPFEYNKALYFVVQGENKKEAVIDEKGKEIFELIFQDVILDYDEQGFLIVKASNGKYGLYDIHGNKILDTIYDKIYEIVGNKVQVLLNGEDGFAIIE